MMSVSPQVAERIRRPMPSGLSVLPGSLPVVAFGDPDRAAVATLSLNPSWKEFESSSGAWLHGADRRLASLTSLGIGDFRELDDDRVEQVVAESNAYFRGRNWYKGWFHWLESLLTGAGAASYMDGTACHLDLVQWATKPAQGELSAEIWNRLVDQDAEFLQWQLRSSNVSTVLCNGSSVVRWLRQARLVDDFEPEVLSYQSAKGSSKIRVFRAIADGVLFVGWNKPLAGAIAAEGRLRLRSWVSQVIEERIPEAAPDAEGPMPDREDEASASSDPVDGYVSIGTAVSGASELHRVLSRWIQTSTASTVGDVGAYGGSPVIIVRMGMDEFVLNRDTKRAAVEAFLSAAARAGGAANLRWHVTANTRGKLNRVSYRDDDEPTPGWFAYLRKPSTEPRDIR